MSSKSDLPERNISEKYSLRRSRRAQPLFSVKKTRLFEDDVKAEIPNESHSTEMAERQKSSSVSVSMSSSRRPLLHSSRVRMGGTNVARIARQMTKGANNSPSGSLEKPRRYINTEKQLKSILKSTKYVVDNRFKLPPMKDTNVFQESVKNPKRDKPINLVKNLSKKEVEKQLSSLMGRKCETYLEKYSVLDERDKIMCKGRLKPSGVESADVLQGNCEDMCDEKERYRRIVQKRLSRYECDETNEVISNLVVKEYSRSAADQEEPLPHELRPLDALERTMNYLLVKIAKNVPSFEEVLAEWYDFLWNRTRAVRKDITQQMISNELAADLVERCVRFHIFTSHRLCSLDINHFDQKMNTENMSKSLQSLRYLYDDLGKKGIYCKNEAELRVYDVMLNFKDSNILRQVLTYREEIRQSEQMRLAFQLYYCLQSGNNVKFFKLLKNKANYLQCCLCHRYFNDIRIRSLYIMNYSTHESAKFPLSKLVDLLGFDTVEETREFCSKFGMHFDVDPDFEEEYIVLSKAKYLAPECDIPLSVQGWIEAKRKGIELDLILSGGKKLDVVLFDAVNSFNDNGIYACDPVIESFLYTSREHENEDDSDDNRYLVSTKHDKEDSGNDIEILIKTAVYEIKSSLIKEVVGEIFSKASTQFELDSMVTVIASSVFERIMKSFISNFVNKWKSDEKRKECREVLHSTNNFLLEDVIERFLEETVALSAKKILKEEQYHRRIKSEFDKLMTRLFDDVITKFIKSSVEEIFVALETSKKMKEQLNGIFKRIDRLWLKQFTDRWKRAVELKKQKRNENLAFLEAHPSTLFYSSQIKMIGIPEFADFDFAPLFTRISCIDALERRKMRLARKAVDHWKNYARFQVAKREYLIGFLPKTRKRKWNWSDSGYRSKRKMKDEKDYDAIKFALNVCEVKNYSFISDFIGDDLPDESTADLTKSVLEPISMENVLAIDNQRISMGVKLAAENMERYGIGRVPPENLDFTSSVDFFNKSGRETRLDLNESVPTLCQVDSQRKQTVNDKYNISRISARVSNLMRQLDNACKKAEEDDSRLCDLLEDR